MMHPPTINSPSFASCILRGPALLPLAFSLPDRFPNSANPVTQALTNLVATLARSLPCSFSSAPLFPRTPHSMGVACPSDRVAAALPDFYLFFSVYRPHTLAFSMMSNRLLTDSSVLIGAIDAARAVLERLQQHKQELLDNPLSTGEVTPLFSLLSINAAASEDYAEAVEETGAADLLVALRHHSMHSSRFFANASKETLDPFPDLIRNICYANGHYPY